LKTDPAGTSKYPGPLADPPSQLAPQLWWQSDWVFILFVFAATLAAYQPVWHAGFFTDDDPLLTKNALVHAASGWWRVWVERPLDYVPATALSFWLEWHLWGSHALGYHLVNVLLHALGAVLIWRILQRLKVPGAMLAAAIFALHPVDVETVAWISERKNTLALVFYAGALLCYLKFEDSNRWNWYWLAAGCFVLGIFSKTAVAPLPFVLLGMAWWRRRKISFKDIQHSLLFFGLAFAAGILGLWIQHSVNRGFTVRPETPLARVAGAGKAVWFYFDKCLWPQKLLFLYPKWHVDAKDPLSYLPTLLVLAVLGLAWAFRHGWGRSVLFSFGYFVVLLLPVLGFVDISFMFATLVADHWQYFALIGPIAFVAAGLAILTEGWNPWLRAGLSAILLAGLGMWTWQDTNIFADPYRLWAITVDQNPESFVAQSALGNALFVKGQVDEAIQRYEKAVAIEPTYYEAHYDLGNIYLRQGQPAKALFEYQNALNIRPEAKALNNVAWILAACPNAALRNGPKAVEIASAAAEQTKDTDPSVLGTLAAAYAEAGQFPAAIAEGQHAMQIAAGMNKTNFMTGLQAQIELYQRGVPYRDASMLPTGRP